MQYSLNVILIKWLTLAAILFAAVPLFAQRSSFSKRSNQQIAAEKISLFPLSVFDPSPEPPSNRPDTANFKPENFTFPSIDRQTLEDRLSKGVPKTTSSCKPTWGTFSFRVNASGNVDSTRYDGNLNETISKRILNNIKETSGLWQVRKNTKSTNVAWFIYPVFDFGMLYQENSNCSETDKLLQKTVWSLSHLVDVIWANADRDYNRATIIRAAKRNGKFEVKM